MPRPSAKRAVAPASSRPQPRPGPAEDVQRTARTTRAREFLSAERKREEELEKKGYWF